MEHLPASKAERFEHGSVTAHEYNLESAPLNLARISIRGRYPEAGYTRNLVSDSVVHVVDGSGVLINNEGLVFELHKNDQAHIAVNDAYYFEGDLEIIYAATPQWTPEQTEQIQ